MAAPIEFPPLPLIIPQLPLHGLTRISEYAEWAAEHDFRGFRGRYVADNLGTIWIDGERASVDRQYTNSQWKNIGKETAGCGRFVNELRREHNELLKSERYTGFPPMGWEDMQYYPSDGFKTSGEYMAWAARYNFRDFRNRYLRRARVLACTGDWAIHPMHCEHPPEEWVKTIAAYDNKRSAIRQSVMVEWRQIDPVQQPPKPAKRA